MYCENCGTKLDHKICPNCQLDEYIREYIAEEIRELSQDRKVSEK